MEYSKLTEITVKSQEEMDAVPREFKGKIYIEADHMVQVRQRYCGSVVACGNSSVEAWGNSLVVVWENSSIEARENSSVEAWGNSLVVVWENSSIEARDSSSVVAWGNSLVEAWGNSSVVACGNSSVKANANAQVVDRQRRGKIQIFGNARVVYMPKNIYEFMDFYGIRHTKTKAVFYKAVHKKGSGYYSEYDPEFQYAVGEVKLSKDASEPCAHGIYISCMDWALRFGEEWEDLAILEVETKLSDIVMLSESSWKVQTSRIKVLREAPLEECGAMGKRLARRKSQ